jgi:hypothetical protein
MAAAKSDQWDKVSVAFNKRGPLADGTSSTL